jgi:ABC-type multidrug transport system fused ATPase/permease subunit
MSADNLVKIAVATIGLLVALVGPAAWFFRELVKYLLARIATLETREQTVLTGLLQVAKELTEGQKIVNDFVLESNEERRYEERRRREGGQ